MILAYLSFFYQIYIQSIHSLDGFNLGFLPHFFQGFSAKFLRAMIVPPPPIEICWVHVSNRSTLREISP